MAFLGFFSCFGSSGGGAAGSDDGGEEETLISPLLPPGMLDALHDKYTHSKIELQSMYRTKYPLPGSKNNASNKIKAHCYKNKISC